MEQETLQAVMGLIMNAGNAKSEAVEAIQAAKKGEFTVAKEKLETANEYLVQAHHAQTELLTKEAQGEEMQVTLLVVHSQDHLMTAITFVDLAKEFVEVYERMDEK